MANIGGVQLASEVERGSRLRVAGQELRLERHWGLAALSNDKIGNDKSILRCSLAYGLLFNSAMQGFGSFEKPFASGSAVSFLEHGQGAHFARGFRYAAIVGKKRLQRKSTRTQEK